MLASVTESKSKSFVNTQMVRELHGPGVLIAMSNKQSLISHNH